MFSSPRRSTEARLGLDEIDGVAATAGPGLIGGLIVGVTTGKAIALARGLPFIAVNHLEAHALTAGLTHGLRLSLSAAARLGRTHAASHRQGRRPLHAPRHDLGRCAWRGLRQGGEAARPRLSRRPRGRGVRQARPRQRIALPRPMLGRPEPHFSLAGLKTALRHEAMKRAPLSEQDVADLCASFQEAAADVVSDRTRRAMELYVDALGNDAQTRARRRRRRRRQSALARGARRRRRRAGLHA